MDAIAEMVVRGHEQVCFCHDADTGLKAIIAVHSTVLGPALGGTRVWAYESTDAALADVLRLSRAMTYKASLAGLDLGGGKAVIVRDPKRAPTSDAFRAYGRFIDSLSGRYVTAEDVGTDESAMDAIRQSTRHVTGGAYKGGYGDPSPITAIGVVEGIKSAIEAVFGSADLEGKTVAVQGVGHVGSHICRLLHQGGAKLLLADVNADRVAQVAAATGGKVLGVNEIVSAGCDVFCPAALGGIINDQTIGRLHCRIVAGAANNPLAEDRHADELDRRGILYIPDYAINAGGLIHVGAEYLGLPKDDALAKAHAIGLTVRKIIQQARSQSITTLAAANRIAETRIRTRKSTPPMTAVSAN